MYPDGYILIFSQEQKQIFDEYLKENPESFLKNLKLSPTDHHWIGDISSREFYLSIIETKKKGNLVLYKRLIELGRIQDGSFSCNLANMQRDYDRYITMIY